MKVMPLGTPTPVTVPTAVRPAVAARLGEAKNCRSCNAIDVPLTKTSGDWAAAARSHSAANVFVPSSLVTSSCCSSSVVKSSCSTCAVGAAAGVCGASAPSIGAGKTVAAAAKEAATAP